MDQNEILIVISTLILGIYSVYLLFQLRRANLHEYVPIPNLIASKIRNVDSIFEWVFILAGLLQSTIFQFYTWFVGNPNHNVYFIMKLLGFSLFPLIIIIVIWINSHLIDNQSISIFFRILSWSMLMPHLYFHILTCYLYTFVEFGRDYPFVDSIITALILFIVAGILYITTLKVINKYKDLNPKLNYWKKFGSTYLPIIFGVLFSASIMLLCI